MNIYVHIYSAGLLNLSLLHVFTPKSHTFRKYSLHKFFDLFDLFCKSVAILSFMGREWDNLSFYNTYPDGGQGPIQHSGR